MSKRDDRANRQVEEALLKRAVGYEYTEDTYERRSGEGEMVLVKQVRKHQPPDPKTAMWWLEKREPFRWGEGAADSEGCGVILLPKIEE